MTRATPKRTTRCAFCAIVAGRLPATVVHRDARTVAFLDLRQANPGHVLVVPRRHIADIREADRLTAGALMDGVARVARAVGRAFDHEGLSIWHSIGPAADQEVLHNDAHDLLGCATRARAQEQPIELPQLRHL